MKIFIKILISNFLLFQTSFSYSQSSYQYHKDIGWIIFIESSQGHLYSYLLDSYKDFSCLKASNVCKDSSGDIHFRDKFSNWNRLIKLRGYPRDEYFLINAEFEAVEISEFDYYSIVFYFDLIFGVEEPENFSLERLNEIIEYSKNNFKDNETLQNLVQEIESHNTYSRLIYEQNTTNIYAHTAIAPTVIIFSTATGWISLKTLLITLGLGFACWFIIDEWLGSHSYRKFCSPDVTAMSNPEKYMKIQERNEKYHEDMDERVKRHNPEHYKEIMRSREESNKKARQRRFLKEEFKKRRRIG